MKKILWLASWYPDRSEPLSGDFIERHAMAAALYNHITVIHVVKDHDNKTSAGSTIERKEYHVLLYSVTGYYRSAFPIARSVVSGITQFFLQKKLIDTYIKENGKPDLINVHICYKAGLGALYCKWRYGIKYIVSEQWTIFCPEANPGLSDQPMIARWLIRLIYTNSSGCSAVSKYLATSLAEKYRIPLPVRIPNVVDTTLFRPSPDKYPSFTFIHISVLNYQKSPEQILEAVKRLKQKTALPFRLIIYGPVLSSIQELIRENKIEDVIDYRGEVLQNILSAEVSKCHTLLLYSRFETFGCVVIEAFASGIPVIASDIPVMHELVHENENGTFVPAEQPELLADRMLWVMENYKKFNSGTITSAADDFSFTRIGKMFDELYNRLMN